MINKHCPVSKRLEIKLSIKYIRNIYLPPGYLMSNQFICIGKINKVSKVALKLQFNSFLFFCIKVSHCVFNAVNPNDIIIFLGTNREYFNCFFSSNIIYLRPFS